MDRNIMIMLIAGIVAGAVVGAGTATLLTDNGNPPPGEEGGDELFHVLGFQDLNLFALFEGAVDMEIIDGVLDILQNFVHEKAELMPELR